MTIVPLLLFCSLALVVGSLVLFVFSAKQGDCHDAERMCLLPLEEDSTPPAAAPDLSTDPRSEPR
jgi:hypothetical protein